MDAFFLGIAAQVVVPERGFEHLEHVQFGVFAEHDVAQGVAELGEVASFFEVLADEDFGLEDPFGNRLIRRGAWSMASLEAKCSSSFCPCRGTRAAGMLSQRR